VGGHRSFLAEAKIQSPGGDSSSYGEQCSRDTLFSQSVLAFHCQLSFRQYVMPIHPLCASGTAKRAAAEVPMDCLTTLKMNTKSKAA